MTPINDNMQPIAARAHAEFIAQLRLRGEASACAIIEATRVALGLREEQCGGEILDAMCLAIRQGLVKCNTADLDRQSICIGQQTVLTAAFPAVLQ